MKRNIRERAAVVVVALTCMSAGAANSAPATVQDSLLQSQIEVTWQDQAQGLAQLLADRLNVPYVAPRPLETRISIKQHDGGTVGDLLAAINRQLNTGTTLQIVQGSLGPQLEVRTSEIATETAVATPIVGAVDPAPTRAQVEGLFAAPVLSASWVDAARHNWKASFISGASSQPAKRWELQLKDITLSKAFSRWAEAAGYRMKWDATKQVLIGGPDVYEMPFEEAVTAALSTPGIQQSEYPLEVCFYPNTPPLARVTLRGAQEKECK